MATQSDLDTYFASFGIATATVSAVGVDGAANVAGKDPRGALKRLFAVKREAGGPGGLVTRRLPRWRAEYGAGSSPGSESRGRSA